MQALGVQTLLDRDSIGVNAHCGSGGQMCKPLLGGREERMNRGLMHTVEPKTKLLHPVLPLIHRGYSPHHKASDQSPVESQGCTTNYAG